MAFLRSTSPGRWRGRDPRPAGAAAPSGHGRLPGLGELRAMSRQHLTVWEPQWARDELTRSAFRRRLRQYQREMKEDLGYAFLIFRQADAMLPGGLSISNVRRGVAQAASTATGSAAPRRPRPQTDGSRPRRRSPSSRSGCTGWRRRARPTTTASSRVLQKAGFKREGMARRYLQDQRPLAGSRSVHPAARRWGRRMART